MVNQEEPPEARASTLLDTSLPPQEIQETTSEDLVPRDPISQDNQKSTSENDSEQEQLQSTNDVPSECLVNQEPTHEPKNLQKTPSESAKTDPKAIQDNQFDSTLTQDTPSESHVIQDSPSEPQPIQDSPSDPQTPTKNEKFEINHTEEPHQNTNAESKASPELQPCDSVSQNMPATEQTADISQPVTVEESQPELSTPPIPKGSYNIDFDSIDLENFNPFGTKSNVTKDIDSQAVGNKSDLTSSKPVSQEQMKPVPSPGETLDVPDVPETLKQEIVTDVPEVPSSGQEIPVIEPGNEPQVPLEKNKVQSKPQEQERTEVYEPKSEGPSEEGTNIDWASEEEALSTVQVQEEHVTQSESLPTTPPKDLPSPAVVEPPSGDQEAPSSPPLIPKGSYNIDFDSIDLENFNPFGTKSKVGHDNDSIPVNAKPIEVGTPEIDHDVPKQPPKKASAKKSPPKKVSPRKVSPKKAPPKKEIEDTDDSFHDAVEDVTSKKEQEEAPAHAQTKVSSEDFEVYMYF